MPLEERNEAVVDLVGGPDWLAVTPEAVWVKRDSGHVDGIDPSTNTIAATGTVSADLCQGLGASADGVWSCSGTDLVRVDPATGAVAATVPVRKVYDQGQLAVGHGHVWVLTGDGSTLVGVGTATDAVEVEVPLGVRCVEATVTTTHVWIACPFDGLVLRVDPTTAEVDGQVGGVPGARAIAAADDVWVGYDGGLAQIDTERVEVTAAVEVRPGRTGSVAATADAVWVRAADPFLRRVDPETLALAEEITSTETSGGAVIVAFGSLWATAYEGRSLYRISAAGVPQRVR